MVLVQTDDIEFMRNHTESLNVRKIWELDSDDTKAFHLHPKDIGGAILSVDQMEPPESWRWAGQGWESRQALWVSTIRSVSIQANDPENNLIIPLIKWRLGALLVGLWRAALSL
jgi:hypothetical protein